MGHGASLDQLNTEVTSAIVAAEDALRLAIARWRHVETVEHLIGNHSDVSKIEQIISMRGAVYADKTASALEKLLEGR